MSIQPTGHKWRQIYRNYHHQARQRNDPCWICGKPIDWNAPPQTPAAFELDHAQPRSQRPDLAYETTNLRTAHSKCNRRRGNRHPPNPAGTTAGPPPPGRTNNMTWSDAARKASAEARRRGAKRTAGHPVGITTATRTRAANPRTQHGVHSYDPSPNQTERKGNTTRAKKPARDIGRVYDRKGRATNRTKAY